MFVPLLIEIGIVVLNIFMFDTSHMAQSVRASAVSDLICQNRQSHRQTLGNSCKGHGSSENIIF